MPHRNASDLTRRDFIRDGSVASLLGMLGAVELRAAEPTNAEVKPAAGPKVKLGIIGLGPRGRDIITSLQLQAEAEIAVVCDHYPRRLRWGRSSSRASRCARIRNDIFSCNSSAAARRATP